MDNKTFGNSKCVLDLVDEMLAFGDVKVNTKIGRMFSRYNQGVRNISTIGDTNIKESLAKLWLEHYKEKINKGITLPLSIKSRLLNLMQAKYKLAIKK